MLCWISGKGHRGVQQINTPSPSGEGEGGEAQKQICHTPGHR